MRKKVLVVDGDVRARETAVEYLRGNGFEAVDCDTPFKVMHSLSEFRPDVVLLDFDMPELSGSSVAEVIRKHITLGDTRIVMLSSMDDSEVEKCVGDGLADACYSMAEGLAGLGETIEGVINRSTH